MFLCVSTKKADEPILFIQIATIHIYLLNLLKPIRWARHNEFSKKNTPFNVRKQEKYT
jgi:hypothetical protein